MSRSSCTSTCRDARPRRAALLIFATALLDLQSAPARADAQQDYVRFCAPCHGIRGNGRGRMAKLLTPQPRDFTRGSFKFRSTPSGSLPRDEDILRVIDEGLRGTAMIGWRRTIPTRRMRELVQVVKRFSRRFAEEEVPPSIPVPPEPPVDPRSVARGRAVYQKMQCAECHGRGAHGDGPSVPTLRDDWDNPIIPSDLTRRDDVRRRSPRGMMMVMLSGMNGTPMPSYADTITAEESWDLVRYLVSLQRQRSWWRALTDPPLAWRGSR